MKHFFLQSRWTVIQHTEQMPPSPRHNISALGDFQAVKFRNNLLKYQFSRSTRQFGQKCKSPQKGALVMSMAVDCGSENSSPEDKPLTVSRTQRRSAVRRRILESDDDEADALASFLKSPGRQTAARLPVTTPPGSTRAFHNLSNLPIPSPECLIASKGQRLADATCSNHDRSIREWFGKPGIMELPVLLTPEGVHSYAAAGCNTPATAEGLPLKPGQGKSTSTDDPASPLIVPRSTRVPRTARRVIYEDVSDSEPFGSSPPMRPGAKLTMAYGGSTKLNEESSCTQSLRVRLEVGRASTAAGVPDSACHLASIPIAGTLGSSFQDIQGIDVEPRSVMGDPSNLEVSHFVHLLQQQLPLPDQWFDSEVAFGSATQSPAQGADNEVAFGSATQSPAQGADNEVAFGSATQSPAQGADSGVALGLGQVNGPDIVPNFHCSSFAHTLNLASFFPTNLQIGDARTGASLGVFSERCPHVDEGAGGSDARSSWVGNETATEPAIVMSEPLLDPSNLAKVPRRRQGLREGCNGLASASSDLFGELVYDLCGELELLTQLRNLSLVSNELHHPTDDEAPDSTDYVSADEDPAAMSPPRPSQWLPPPLLFPPQRPPLELLDMTLLSSSGSSFAASSMAGGSVVRSIPPGADGDEPTEPPFADSSSPPGLLDVYHQAQPAAVRTETAGPVTGTGPSSCVEIVGTAAPSAGSTGSIGCADGDKATDSRAGREALPSDESGSDLELYLEIRRKRPTTARRKAVLVDLTGSEPNSPQQPGPACPPHAAGNEWQMVSHADAGDSGKGNSRYGGGCEPAGPPNSVAITEVLAAPPLVENGRWRSTGGPDPYDPSNIASTSTTEPSDSEESIVSGFQDCALKTPSKAGTRDSTGGAAFVTQMRDEQADCSGMELSGWREQPQPQRTLPTDGREKMNISRKDPRGRTGARRAEQRAFLAARAGLAQELYAKWNELVFEGQLPANLPLVWNSRLTATAGRVVGAGCPSGTRRCVAAKLELSPRLIDSIDKLRNTLSHEMCHVAAWHINQDYDRPHGPSWGSWARKFMMCDPSLVIKRTHDYISQYAHRWRCTNGVCGKEYGRQRQTINVDVHVCAVCHSKLRYLGHFDKHGNLKAPKMAATPAPGTPGPADGTGGLITGTASKTLNGFAQFCKENFRSVRTNMPPQTPASAVFKHMGLLYQKHKANLALIAATGGGLTPGLSASAIGLGLSPDGRTRLILSPRGSSGMLNQQANGASSGERQWQGGNESRSPSHGPVGRLSGAESNELLLRMVDLSLADDGE